MILGEIPRRNARRYPDKTALVFEDRRFTFKEFNNRTNSLVNALSNLGVMKGDRVAVLADSCHQYVEIAFAGVKGGFVVAHFNPSLTPEGLTFLINNAGVNTIVLGEKYKGLINSLRPELTTVNNFIILGNSQDDMKSYEALIFSSPPTEPDIEVKDDDLYFLPCSSGTTGLPKQTMITNKAFLVSTLDFLQAYQLRHEDIFLFAVPPFWGGMVPLLVFSSFYMGCTLVLLKDITPQSLLKAIDKEKVTTSMFSSFLLLQLLDYPELDRYDHSSLRYVLLVGAPIHKEAWQRAVKVFGNIFGMAYGSAEFGVITCLSPEDVALEEARGKRLQSCGKEAINTEVRVVNEQGEDVAPGEMGELIARGGNIMTGYLNAPQATEDVIRGGYFYT